MLKTFLLIIASLFLLFLFGCKSQDIGQIQGNSIVLVEPTSTVIESPLLNDSNKAINIQLNSIKGISENDATNLCLTIIGEKAEETGFKLAYRCVGAVEFESQNYYVMYRSWLVDDNHWSYIGYAMVSIDGDKIYDGVVDREENYYFGKKLWDK